MIAAPADEPSLAVPDVSSTSAAPAQQLTFNRGSVLSNVAAPQLGPLGVTALNAPSPKQCSASDNALTWALLVLAVLFAMLATLMVCASRKLSQKGADEASASSQEEAQRKAEEPAKSKAAVPAKSNRMPLMDTAKLYALFLVYMGHDDLWDGFYLDADGSPTATPTWLKALRRTVGFTHLHIFYFLSGVTSKAEVKSVHLIKAFVLILFPVVCWTLLDPVIDVDGVLSGKLKSFFGDAFYRPPYDHFLFGLFLLRCFVCPLVGRLSNWGLALAAFVIYLPTGLCLAAGGSISGYQPEMAFGDLATSYAAAYAPTFIAGMLAKRLDLLGLWVAAVERRWWLRLPPLALLLACWVSVGFGHAPHELLVDNLQRPGGNCNGSELNQQGYMPTCDPDAIQVAFDLALALLKGALSVLYFVTSLGAMPTTNVWCATDAGSRTLIGYLLSIKYCRIVASPIAQLAINHGPACWLLHIPCDLLLLAAFTSKTAHFAFWPFLENVWLEGWLLAERVPLPKMVQQYTDWAGGWVAVWVPTFVAVLLAPAAFHHMDECWITW